MEASRSSLGRPWWAGSLGQRLLVLLVAGVLLFLAMANLRSRANWREAEDGVLWTDTAEGVVASDVAPDGPGERAGVTPGDLLIALDGRQIDRADDVVGILHREKDGKALTYTVLRDGQRGLVQLTLQNGPEGARALYFVQVAVAIFTLLVGCMVRIRRTADQASLHFFWLSVAFFGVFAFSFSGRFDRLDWVFYWADVVAVLLLPPLFLHFALVFPERPNAWAGTAVARTVLPLLYMPAVLLGVIRAAMIVRPSPDGAWLTQTLEIVDRLELAYLAICVLAGLAVMVRALGSVRSMTARRQLRWIVGGTTIGGVPFVLGYVVPYLFGLEPGPQLGLLTIPLAFVPLAFASAVVRYRLMDVEVIIKRTVVYAAAITAIAAMYAVLLKLAGELFLGGTDQHNSVIAVLATLVVVLLAPMVKNTIQMVFDRAYYRDRYDYRRALVGFARDLNSDLELQRLSERLVERVGETLVLDRMALYIAPIGDPVPSHYLATQSVGFDGMPPLLLVESGIGSRLRAGHTVSLDDPLTARRFAATEVSFWREHGLQCFVPCVSKEGTIAVMALGGKGTGEPLNSEDMALLEAVAGQVATAFENGRLYHQLQLKAAELDRERSFNENIIESLDDGLLVAGLDDRVVRWNPALEQLYGVSRQDAVGRSLGELFDEGLLSTLRASRRESGDVALYRVPLTSRHAAGPRKLLVNLAAAPLRTIDQQCVGTIVIVEDVTSRVQLEEQLQISEKMASIGLLAAGVAHEVNTPLTGISSFTQMLLESADPDDPRTKLLEKIERQSFRAAKIVNGLLNLARPGQVDPGRVDLHAVINDVLSLLEHQFKSGNIQVRKDLSPTAPIVHAVEYKLQQVFLNLFLNARDAMPRGGWLSLSTRLEHGHVNVEVGDTGGGIQSQWLSRIYDPFFTTKPIGQGTGLGLSITYGIVREHGGVITCESSEGNGTVFRLTFPLAQGAADAGRAAEPHEVRSLEPGA
jgi:two-component system, NtrC family, sensor kinase